MPIIYIPCDHCDAISATSIKENKNTLAENLDAFQTPSRFIKNTDINLIKIISNKKIIFSEISNILCAYDCGHYQEKEILDLASEVSTSNRVKVAKSLKKPLIISPKTDGNHRSPNHITEILYNCKKLEIETLHFTNFSFLQSFPVIEINTILELLYNPLLKTPIKEIIWDIDANFELEIENLFKNYDFFSTDPKKNKTQIIKYDLKSFTNEQLEIYSLEKSFKKVLCYSAKSIIKNSLKNDKQAPNIIAKLEEKITYLKEEKNILVQEIATLASYRIDPEIKETIARYEEILNIYLERINILNDELIRSEEYSEETHQDILEFFQLMEERRIEERRIEYGYHHRRINDQIYAIEHRYDQIDSLFDRQCGIIVESYDIAQEVLSQISELKSIFPLYSLIKKNSKTIKKNQLRVKSIEKDLHDAEITLQENRILYNFAIDNNLFELSEEG